MNTPAAAEHFAEIELWIRGIKEHVHGILCTLHYKNLPPLMLIQLLLVVVMWLNNFPLATGISPQFSPRELIICHCLDYKKHCKAPFGAYCEAQKENNPTNSMLTQGTLSICLGPTGNLQGSYHFLSLVTGKLIKRQCFTELSIPQAIIDRAAHFAKNSPSPDLIFANHHRKPYALARH
jgi:hypothetical protein